MTTAELVQAMTDTGVFESMATFILRRKYPDFEWTIHTGINAEGKTVSGPVDGFALVPGTNTPRYAFAAHTTIQKSRLSEKWLSTVEGRVGDIGKAAELASVIRTSVLSASFVLALTTNKIPGRDIAQKAGILAQENGIELLILEQSQIADYLDNDPEGQWIRYTIFGIEAQRLSTQLLNELSERSTQLYFQEVNRFDSDYWVKREVYDDIGEYADANANSLIFLSGDSGYGKSVAAYNLLEHQVSNQGIGFWIRPEVIERSVSLSEAVLITLQGLCPSLIFTSSSDVLTLLPTGRKMFIIVDDINRISRPSAVIDKLISWIRPIGTKEDLPLPVTIICPVWRNSLEATREYIERHSWIRTVHVGPLTMNESMDTLRAATLKKGIPINDGDMKTIVNNLGNDPVLLGLFSELLDATKLDHLQTATEDVVGKFLDKSIQEIVVSTNGFASEFNLALNQLCLRMVENRRLYPQWPEITSWLNPDSIAVLRNILRDGRICKLEEDGLAFRHDRILEYLIGECIAGQMTVEDYQIENLLDPYYSAPWGRAISKTYIDETILQLLLNRLPLSLFEWLKYVNEPQTEADARTISAMREWLNSYLNEESRLRSVLQSIYEAIIEIDSPAVVEILKDVKDSQRNVFIEMALLRNGEVTPIRSGPVLEPGVNFELRDSIFAQAKSHHRESLIQGVRDLLSSSEDQSCRIGLFLSGFFGFLALEDDIIECWASADDKKLCLEAALWAASQCGHARIPELVDPLMDCWENLDDEPDKHGSSERMELAESLKFAFRHGFSDEIARYFVHAYEQRESLQFAIAYSLEWVNVPDAVELVVRQAAKISAELEGTDKVSPWQLTLSSNWGRSGFSDRGFSDRCISRLKDLWDDPASDDFVRKWAFRFWLTSCDSKSIATLSGIEPASTNYRAALWKRAELSDLTSVQEILPLLESDLHWFLVAHNIWCEALVTATNQSINDHSSGMRTDKAGENTNASYLLSKLIMRIPADDAESLIVQNWDSIMYSSRFVQSALYTGTDKCLELVQEAVANCSHNESLFKGLASHYGLYAIGSRPLTRKQLEDMVPYIEYFDQPSLSELTGYCMRNGIQEWSRENLMPYLNEESRKRYYPNDSELQSELDDYLLRAGGSGQLWIDRWLEGFTERNDPPNRAMVLAETWLSKHLSVRALALVGEIIAISGSREDLAILFKYDIEGPQELIENTRENVSYAVHRRTIL